MTTICEKMNEESICTAGRIIRSGGLVAFPTETVYGLGGDACNPQSARKIFEAKGRPSDNPLIVHIAEINDLYQVASQVSESALRLAEAFWPGPLTMILPKSDRIPFETTGGLHTVAIRMPGHEQALTFIRESGCYIAAPSANVSGRPSPTSYQHVLEDMNGRIDMILDGGEAVIGLESTIVDLTVGKPVVLRPGYISEEMLAKVLGEMEKEDSHLLQAGAEPKAPKAPGMKYRHYAPTGELYVVEGSGRQVVAFINQECRKWMDLGRRTGVIASEETIKEYVADVVCSIGKRSNEDEIAHRLYGVLREFDEQKAEILYSEAFWDNRMSEAIMNRLLKAAGYKVIQASEQLGKTDI